MKEGSEVKGICLDGEETSDVGGQLVPACDRIK